MTNKGPLEVAAHFRQLTEKAERQGLNHDLADAIQRAAGEASASLPRHVRNLSRNVTYQLEGDSLSADAAITSAQLIEELSGVLTKAEEWITYVDIWRDWQQIGGANA